MSMRAPYISMSESSELPMLIAEDLMWGAQPDLKQTLNVNRKVDLSSENSQCDAKIKVNPTYQRQKSTTESSLASLLCNQLMQHQQQQLQDQQMNQSQKPILLNQYPDVRIQILDPSLVNSSANIDQSPETAIGLSNFSPNLLKLIKDFDILVPESIEWTMDDLLLLKKTPVTKSNHDESSADQKHQHLSQSEAIVKSRDKSTVNHHKRPSITSEITNSKRAKGSDMIKPTPQLLQQLMTSPGCQKQRAKPEPLNALPNSPQKVHPQLSSNSVLMNLLVSGCDVSAGYYTCLPRSKVAKA